MNKIYTSGIVPFTPDGLIGLQRRAKWNQKNNEDYAFLGGRRETKANGEFESAEEAMVREAYEELKMKPKTYESIGELEKDRVNEVCVQETFMVPVKDISELNDYEGLGIEAFTIQQARRLHMNPGDDLVLDQIQRYFTQKNIS